MLVEIPDPEVILSVILAFMVGLGGLYGYYKVLSFKKSKSEVSDIISQAERLEYYEKQLIDMKIRLDAFELQITEEKSEDPSLKLKQLLKEWAEDNKVQKQTVTKKEEDVQPKIVPEETVNMPDIHIIDHTNLTDYVLRLITNKTMTSRDMQVTLKKSREHTSRLMKKLFEEGYVHRNIGSKPYTYSITEKGSAKIKPT